MKHHTPTYEQVKRAARLTLTAVFIILAAICLGAVIFMHRPDHLLTTAGYILLAYAINADQIEEYRKAQKRRG